MSLKERRRVSTGCSALSARGLLPALGEDAALVSEADESKRSDGEREHDEDLENIAAVGSQGQDKLFSPICRADALLFGHFGSVLLRAWCLKVKTRPPGLPWFSGLKTLQGEDEDEEDDTHSSAGAGIVIPINAFFRLGY